MSFVEVCFLDELRSEGKKKFLINDENVLLIYLSGEVFAVNSICPHSGGPLDEGEVHDEEITCPWHGYMFNFKSGDCLNYPSCIIRKYKVKLSGERVFVDI